MKKTWQKNVAIFMATQLLSIFGSSLVQFAITLFITLETKSGSATAIIILCSFLPMLLLSPLAGVWADKYNKKLLIIVSDGLIALCTLVVAIFFLTGNDSTWILYVATAVRSLGSAIQGPSVSAILPELVPEDQLTRINGLNSTFQSLITLISPMLSGLLLQFLAIEFIFFIDVLTATIAIIIMLTSFEFEYVPSKFKGKASEYFHELVSGFHYINDLNFLKYLFIFIALFCFMAAPVATLTPLQTVRSYGEEIWRISAIDVVFSGGMLIGGLILSFWGGLKNRIKTMGAFLLLMGITIIVMGLKPAFPIYLVAMVFCGLSLPLINTAGVITIQERVSGEYMGRVFSIMSMINTSALPLGMMLFGPLADRISIETILLLTGGILIICALFLSRNRTLLKAGEPIVKAKTVESVS